MKGMLMLGDRLDTETVSNRMKRMNNKATITTTTMTIMNSKINITLFEEDIHHGRV